MQVTYIHHSGFLVETERFYYLFDYESGNLPPMDAEKPIFVLSSHSHGDHYNPKVFPLLKAAGMRHITAVLSDDIEAPASVPVLSIWAFLSPGVVYRPMMLHGICLYYVLAMILFDKWIPARFSTAFAALVMVIVFNFSIMANISYFWMNKCYEKTFYRGSELMHTIVSHQRNGQSIDTVAFIGNRQDEVYSDDSLFTQKVHVLSACLEEDLLYDHIHTYLFLKNSYDLEIACASDAQLEKLEALDQVRQMPIWPAEGSIQVIDGVLIVRIGE